MSDISAVSWALVPLAFLLPVVLAVLRRPARRDAAAEARAVAGRPYLANLDAVFLAEAGLDLRGFGEPTDFERAGKGLAQAFRHETSTPLSELPVPLRAAIVLLAASAARPARPSAAAEALTRRGDIPAAELDRLSAEMAAGRSAHEAIEDALRGHAWWETVALELMRASRERGGWLVPGDLERLLGAEPHLRAALAASPGGPTAPRATGLANHWLTERATRTAIPHPRVDEAARSLDLLRWRLAGDRA